MRLRQDLLHGAITGFRFKSHPCTIQLSGTLIIASSIAFIKPARRPAPVLRSSGPWITPISAMTAFNQITPGHVAAFERVINDRIGEVSFCFTPVHHHHWDMAIFFPASPATAPAYQNTSPADHRRVLRHHRQISPLFLKIVPRIAQNQGVTFLEAIFSTASMIRQNRPLLLLVASKPIDLVRLTFRLRATALGVV